MQSGCGYVDEDKVPTYINTYIHPFSQLSQKKLKILDLEDFQHELLVELKKSTKKSSCCRVGWWSGGSPVESHLR